MKKQILGFMNVNQLIDNNPHEISMLGEVSTWSRTYSKTQGEYVSSATPGYTFTTFSVTNLADDSSTTLTNPEVSLHIRIVKACLEYAASHIPPLDPGDFRSSIQAEFYSEIESLEFGDLISASNTTLPAWFTFTSKADDKNESRVWLADSYFQVEYPNYDITVVSPLSDPSDFLKPYANVIPLLAARTMTVLVEEAQAQKLIYPETYLRYFEFDFVNRTNPTQKQKTSWFILVYGEAGNDDDTIKDAIVDYLVDSTGQPEEVWQQIFPELFKRTEFVILPQWQNIAIPNMSILTGIYSSFLNLSDGIDYAKEKVDFYDPAWIEKNTINFPLTYKAITLLSIDGQNNEDGYEHLTKIYPDYIPVEATDPDFQRMTVMTQNWVHFMIKLVTAAETATGTSTLPQGLRRKRRGNLWWISGTYNKASFMATQRRNFITG